MPIDQSEKRPCPIEHVPNRYQQELPEEVRQMFLESTHTFDTTNTLYVCPEKLFKLEVTDNGGIYRSYYSYSPDDQGSRKDFMAVATLAFRYKNGILRPTSLFISREKYRRINFFGKPERVPDEEVLEFGYGYNNDQKDLTDISLKYLGHLESGEAETYRFGYSEARIESVSVGIGILEHKATVQLKGEIFNPNLAQLLEGNDQAHKEGTLNFGNWRNVNGKLRVTNLWDSKHFVEITIPDVLDFPEVKSLLFSPETLQDPFTSSHEADRVWTQTGIFSKLKIKWQLKKIDV